MKIYKISSSLARIFPREWVRPGSPGSSVAGFLFMACLFFSATGVSADTESGDHLLSGVDSKDALSFHNSEVERVFMEDNQERELGSQPTMVAWTHPTLSKFAGSSKSGMEKEIQQSPPSQESGLKEKESSRQEWKFSRNQERGFVTILEFPKFCKLGSVWILDGNGNSFGNLSDHLILQSGLSNKAIIPMELRRLRHWAGFVGRNSNMREPSFFLNRPIVFSKDDILLTPLGSVIIPTSFRIGGIQKGRGRIASELVLIEHSVGDGSEWSGVHEEGWMGRTLLPGKGVVSTDSRFIRQTLGRVASYIRIHRIVGFSEKEEGLKYRVKKGIEKNLGDKNISLWLPNLPELHSTNSSTQCESSPLRSMTMKSARDWKCSCLQARMTFHSAQSRFL